MVFRLARGLLAVVAIAFTAPAFAGGPQWVQVKSPNFTVFTDGGEKRGRDVALRFEQLRLVFAFIFNQRAKVQTGVPVRIIAFRNNKELRQVGPKWEGKDVALAGFFEPSDSMAFVALDLSAEGGWSTVFHEYAHMLLNANVDQTPLWFDEGFAEFFSAIQINGSEFEYGRPPQHTVRLLLEQSRRIPLIELFRITHKDKVYNTGDLRSLFYAQSWLAMHYFWFNPQQATKTVAYLGLLDQGVSIPEAIQRAFGVEPKVLDKELENHLRTGRANIWHSKLPPGSDKFDVAVTNLDELEARAAVAEMKLQNRDRSEEAISDFDAILKERPGNAVALRGLGYGALRKQDLKTAADYFRRAAAADSGDPRVHYYSAVLRQEMGAEHNPELLRDMRTSLHKAVALDPSLADAYAWLGLTYAWEHDYASAIPPMEKALRLSPRKEHYAVNLAGFYLQQKQYDDAEKLLKRLRSNSESDMMAQIDEMLNFMAQLKNSGERLVVNSEPKPSPASSGETSTVAESSSSLNESEVLRFFSGSLTRVDCTGNRAVFTFASQAGVWRADGDLREVAFGGRAPFSCSWRDKKVKGFWHPGKGDQRVLVALEVE
jgi:tetratricopeptide (TPR) repeat protein